MDESSGVREREKGEEGFGKRGEGERARRRA